MTRIAGIEIVQAATFQRVSSGNLLLICGKLWVFALLLCALAPSTGAQPVAGNSPPADVALTSFPRRTNPLDKITPVTDTLLAYVPDSDWLTWRRGHDAAGYSPLATINTDNVRHLRSVWTWSLPNGPNEGTPLVHDGCCSCMPSATRFRRSMPRPGTCCGNIHGSSRPARHQASSVPLRSMATASTCRPRMCTSWRSMSEPAKLSGIRRSVAARRALE